MAQIRLVKNDDDGTADIRMGGGSNGVLADTFISIGPGESYGDLSYETLAEAGTGKHSVDKLRQRQAERKAATRHYRTPEKRARVRDGD